MSSKMATMWFSMLLFYSVYCSKSYFPISRENQFHLTPKKRNVGRNLYINTAVNCQQIHGAWKIESSTSKNTTVVGYYYYYYGVHLHSYSLYSLYIDSASSLCKVNSTDCMNKNVHSLCHVSHKCGDTDYYCTILAVLMANGKMGKNM